MLKKVAAAVLLVITGTGIQVRAQQAPKEKTLLWEISGNGLEKASYLFGTMHMLCPDDFVITEKTKKAFEKTSRLVVEANLFDPAEMAVAQKAFVSDIPLSKKLSPAQYAEIDSMLRAETGIPLKQFDNAKLSLLVSLMSTRSFNCATPKMYEAEFMKTATSTHKAIGSLETMAEQMAFFNQAFTDEYTLNLLKNFTESKAGTVHMIRNYKEENLEGLYRIVINAPGMDDRTNDLVLFNRNINWANRMPDMMKKESSFFAVGAAHLAGDRGVISLLRAKGYTVKPILN